MTFSTPHHGQRPIQSNYQEMATKRCFVELVKKYLGMNAEFLKTFLRISVMFVNEEVCEIVLIVLTMSSPQLFSFSKL